MLLPMPSSHYQAVAEEQTSARQPGACPRCLARPSHTTSVFASAGTRMSGNLDKASYCFSLARHNAIVILPLVRRGVFQLRQQTIAGRRCVSTQRNGSPRWKRIPKPLNQLETRSEAQSSWRAEGVTIRELTSAKYELQVTAQPSDVLTRCNFARVAEKLRTSSPVLQPLLRQRRQ